MAEYASLLWVFEKVGIDFDPAGSKKPAKRRAASRKIDAEEPPKMTGETFVPGEPRGKRFIPGGSL
jgi:hypothetical protein